MAASMNKITVYRNRIGDNVTAQLTDYPHVQAVGASRTEAIVRLLREQLGFHVILRDQDSGLVSRDEDSGLEIGGDVRRRRDSWWDNG